MSKNNHRYTRNMLQFVVLNLCILHYYILKVVRLNIKLLDTAFGVIQTTHVNNQLSY